MKKIILSILFATIGIISNQKVQSQIIVTPTLCLQTSGGCDVTSYPNSTLYPNYYEVNLRVTAMVNTFQSGHFSLSCERRVQGTTAWGQFTPNLTLFPNTGPSSPLSSTYSGTAKTTHLEGTIYQYRVKVVFSSTSGSKTVYTPIRTATVLGVSAPCFTMLNVQSTQTENSYYGPQSVKTICQNAVTIDGSCSKFEEGYHIRIAEFNLATWGFGTDYYNNWVSGGQAPPFISLNALAAQNGKYFQPGKLYAVGFSIGPVWKSAEIQFFRVINTCRVANESNNEDIKNNIASEFDEEVTLGSTQLEFYPNPIKNNLLLTINNDEKIISYIIYDNSGLIVKKDRFQTASSKQNINLSELKKGLYFIIIESDKGNYRQKLIKE
jgi:hypothetical protein